MLYKYIYRLQPTSKRFRSRILVALKRADFVFSDDRVDCSCLTAESVQGATLTLQSVDDVHGRDRLALGVLGVGDRIADHVLEEHFQDTASLLVDQTRDTLDTASTSKTTDGRLRDSLDVVTKNFAMTLGATLSKTFASFTATRHDDDEDDVNTTTSRCRMKRVSEFRFVFQRSIVYETVSVVIHSISFTVVTHCLFVPSIRNIY